MSTAMTMTIRASLYGYLSESSNEIIKLIDNGVDFLSLRTSDNGGETQFEIWSETEMIYQITTGYPFSEENELELQFSFGYNGLDTQ